MIVFSPAETFSGEIYMQRRFLMNKKTAERIVTLIALLGILALFTYFLKDIMIPLFKM